MLTSGDLHSILIQKYIQFERRFDFTRFPGEGSQWKAHSREVRNGEDLQRRARRRYCRLTKPEMFLRRHPKI